jgi:hypothetical protein
MSDMRLLRCTSLKATTLAYRALPAKREAFSALLGRFETGDWDMPNPEAELRTLALLAVQKTDPEDIYLPVVVNAGPELLLFTVKLLTGETRVCLLSEIPEDHPLLKCFLTPTPRANHERHLPELPDPRHAHGEDVPHSQR